MEFSQAELERYLDETLPVDRMTAIEEALRRHPELAQQLIAINGRRDAGVHSLGEIWRHSRLSCPTRSELGSYLLQALPAELADYCKFHLETVGCRYCQANLADLEAQRAEAAERTQQRRRKFFQSSAGYLKR